MTPRSAGKILLIFVLVLLISAYGAFQISRSRTFQFFGGLTNRVETQEKVVALTFDDAPSSHTSEILKILTEKGIRATFYLIGQSVERYPDQARQIVSQGHEIGNHSYSHQRFLLKS